LNDDKKCIRCDRVSHSKNECSTINSECFECHKIDHWKQMCRIKKRNDQFKSSRRDDKIDDESSITEEITLMIKRLIDKVESVESIKSAESSEFLVNSLNDHITRKFLIRKSLITSFAIDHFLSHTSSKFSSARRARKRNSLRRALNRFKWILLTIKIDQN
jgi:hypothetical protein